MVNLFPILNMVAIVALSFMLAFSIFNFTMYIVKQQRYKGKGVFLALFYIFAFFNQALMLSELWLQWYHNPFYIIFYLSLWEIATYTLFGMA